MGDSDKHNDETQDSSGPGTEIRDNQAPVPPNIDDPSAISIIARDCLQRFKIICTLLKESEDTPEVRLAVQDAHSRFKAWGGNIAAFHDGTVRTSLDSRLREAPNVRGRALRILEDLQEYIYEATLIVTGEKSDERLDLSDSSDEEFSIKNDVEENQSELQSLISAIFSSNASLMKLSMVIRNSPLRDDYIKAASRFKDWNPYPDIGHVREKHGLAKGSTEWLINRLGKGITRRRQFLKYRVEHFDKISGAWDDGEQAEKNDQKPEKTVASTKATTFFGQDNFLQRDGSDTAGSFGSQTSYEATVIGDDYTSQKLTVPPPPKYAFPGIFFEFGEPFNCPYCYTEQTVKNKAAWKKHVFRDLKPYICTFRECDLMMFRSRNEWFAHELQNHRRQWICQHCQQSAFTSSMAFSKHMTASHSAVLANSHLQAVLLQSEEPVDAISSLACPLCDDWETNIKTRYDRQDHDTALPTNLRIEPHGTKNQFRRHLGRHMEQLALFALPMGNIDETIDIELDSTDDEDEDALDHRLDEAEENLEAAIVEVEERRSSVSPSVQVDFDPPHTDGTHSSGNEEDVRFNINTETGTFYSTSPSSSHARFTAEEWNDKFNDGTYYQLDSTSIPNVREPIPPPLPPPEYLAEGENNGSDMLWQWRNSDEGKQHLENFRNDMKEEGHKGYQKQGEGSNQQKDVIRPIEDLKELGVNEDLIASLSKQGTELLEQTPDRDRPTWTRMSLKHISLETLKHFKMDWEYDTDQNYILIRRWIPEDEQDILWSHTRAVRERRKSILKATKEGKRIQNEDDSD